MGQEVRLMVREALNSFVHQDEKLARDVLGRDDRVDEFKSKIFRECVSIMKAKPETIDQGLALILIARNLERMGDHATNIAEDVIYVITAKDIRHGAKVEFLKQTKK